MDQGFSPGRVRGSGGWRGWRGCQRGFGRTEDGGGAALSRTRALPHALWRARLLPHPPLPELRRKTPLPPALRNLLRQALPRAIAGAGSLHGGVATWWRSPVVPARRGCLRLPGNPSHFPLQPGSRRQPLLAPELHQALGRLTGQALGALPCSPSAFRTSRGLPF